MGKNKYRGIRTIHLKLYTNFVNLKIFHIILLLKVSIEDDERM